MPSAEYRGIFRGHISFWIEFIDTEQPTRTIIKQSAIASIKGAEPTLGVKELRKRVAAALGIDLKVFMNRKLVSLSCPTSPLPFLSLSRGRAHPHVYKHSHTHTFLHLFFLTKATSNSFGSYHILFLMRHVA